MKAGHIVLMNPSNQASVEHFDLLKKQWLENAEKLRSLVDEAIDTTAFIRANGTFTEDQRVTGLHDIVSQLCSLKGKFIISVCVKSIP